MSGVYVKGLRVAYDDKVIFENFDIDFQEGGINVILGGSGVGKTTLLNVLAGLVPYDGEVRGCEDGVSYIFQKDRLIPTISVYKNLDLVLRNEIKDKNKRKEEIDKILSLLEIEGEGKKLPTQLSGGQAQRAAMARAYLYPRKVLLLDEPFKALDTALKSRLLAKLVELNEREGRTVIFVTHAIDECLLCADKFFVLSSNPVRVSLAGNIKSDKKTRKLNDAESNEIRERLLEAIYEENEKLSDTSKNA